MWPFNKKPADAIETRAVTNGFTAEIMAARESYISGRRGVAELTATTQTCIGLWENGIGMADVTGTDMLDRVSLAMAGRSLAIRGEALFLITEDGLVPCSDWDMRTRNGKPTAYRVGIAEAGGGRTQTVLSGEVLHFRIGADIAAPWIGTAPLRRAQLTAGLLQSVETVLSEVFDLAPVGSQIVPFPESPDTDMEALARGFRGQRGRVLLRESVNVAAAGGPTPQADWRPQDVGPDLAKAMTTETLSAARDAICGAFGVLPGLLNPAATGPAIREAQRHLAQWQLEPIGVLIAQEVTDKLGVQVAIDTMRPLQAFDAGGRARAVAGIVQALALAKDAGVDPVAALNLVDWKESA